MKTILIRLVLALAAFLPVRFLRAGEADDESDRSGQVRVDVVVDMSDAGRKITHPTPTRPAFYLPISVGYKNFGYAHDFQRPPANEWEIQHALAVALHNQGYQLMTKQGHPSLVLMFWWGYMAPQSQDLGNPGGLIERPGSLNAPSNFFWGSGQGKGPGATAGFEDNFVSGQAFGSGNYNGAAGIGSTSQIDDGNGASAFPSFSLGFRIANQEQMLSMVAGETVNDHQKFLDPRLENIEQMLDEPRYYVLVSAFDFQSWLHHKPVLLWRAHVSTELWGHYFDQVIGTLITTAAPLFGRETKAPNFISAPVLPVGRVLLGRPEVTNYPAVAGKASP